MTSVRHTIFVTNDIGLLTHWQATFGTKAHTVVHQIEDFFQVLPSGPSTAWIDLSVARLPNWTSDVWRAVFQNEQIRVVAASSNPRDEEAMQALDAGCVAYCHAFSHSKTLKQVKEVVEAGNVWIGKALMQRLLQGVTRAVPVNGTHEGSWREELTQREIEVAVLAANGASNQSIARQCGITERTVKAHLSAIFHKLNVTDRLQLALRVHGIH